MESMTVRAAVTGTTDGVLFVTGDESGVSNDSLTLRRNAVNGQYVDILFGTQLRYRGLFSAINRFDVDGLSGDDTLLIDGDDTLGVALEKEVLFLGGPGNDLLSWDTTASPLVTQVEFDGGTGTSDRINYTGQDASETTAFTQSGLYVEFSPTIASAAIAVGRLKNVEKVYYYASGGNDVLDASSVPSSVAIDFYFYGEAGDDDLTGNDRANWLYGGSGLDEIWGLGGNDFLFGDGDADFLDGGAGTDTMDGGAGNDRFFFGGLYVILDDVINNFGDTAGNEDIIDWTFVSTTYIEQDFGIGVWIKDTGGKKILLSFFSAANFGDDDIELS